MKTPLFNIHDLVLLATFMSCLLLAVMQWLMRRQPSAPRRLLALFFANQALAVLSTFLFWSEPLQGMGTVAATVLVGLLSLSHMAQGPLLYLYTAALVDRNFRWRRHGLPHALVVAAYVLLATGVFAFFRLAAGAEAPFPHMPGHYQYLPEKLHLLQRSAIVVYGVLCLVLIGRYSRSLKQALSNIEHTRPRYLALLLGGFLFSWLWGLGTHVAGYWMQAATSDVLGIANNYLHFFLLQALFLLSLLQAGRVEATDLKAAPPDNEPAVPEEAIARVRRGMEQEQLFLQPNISVEAFSRRIGLPVRETSQVINRHLNTNFFEYTNTQRVALAQALLRDPDHAGRSITDILLSCGFNSKTAFNRFFKRVTGQTPSQYRQAFRNPPERR